NRERKRFGERRLNTESRLRQKQRHLKLIEINEKMRTPGKLMRANRVFDSSSFISVGACNAKVQGRVPVFQQGERVQEQRVILPRNESPDVHEERRGHLVRQTRVRSAGTVEDSCVDPVGDDIDSGGGNGEL